MWIMGIAAPFWKEPICKELSAVLCIRRLSMNVRYGCRLAMACFEMRWGQLMSCEKLCRGHFCSRSDESLQSLYFLTSYHCFNVSPVYPALHTSGLYHLLSLPLTSVLLQQELQRMGYFHFKIRPMSMLFLALGMPTCPSTESHRCPVMALVSSLWLSLTNWCVLEH